MAIRDRMSGNEAVAMAMKQINPDVMGAFPITPSTEIPQYFSEYIANGLVDTEFIAVESEHSAMSTCIGASAAGARAVTATSSAGLALMWELLYVAASSRLPITMAVVNRALTGPIDLYRRVLHGDCVSVAGGGAEICAFYQGRDHVRLGARIGGHLLGDFSGGSLGLVRMVGRSSHHRQPDFHGSYDRQESGEGKGRAARIINFKMRIIGKLLIFFGKLCLLKF